MILMNCFKMKADWQPLIWKRVDLTAVVVVVVVVVVDLSI